MAVDNAPATNALNLLNGIDYGAVIGAPLQAAITAQAMAAKSTWEFIQEVGLQTDANGNKSAVNVTFTYQKGGELVKLIVPILTIVPIPAIVVTNIDIAFKANINASASQSSQQSESTDIGGELSGGAKVGWGPFSIDANFKANYSSKKDSKATQDSQYSVEYTQDVTVKAAQAGIPAGLATVLNILSNAATGASLDGDLMVSPSLITLDFNNPEETRPFSIKVVDSNGLNVKGSNVTISVPPAGTNLAYTLSLMNMKVSESAHRSLKIDLGNAITIGVAPLGKQVHWDPNNKIQLETGDNGTIDLIIGLKTNDEASKNLPFDGIFELEINTTIDGKDREFKLPVKVNNAPSQRLIPSDDQKWIKISDGTEKPITLKLVTDNDQGLKELSNKTITATWDSVPPPQGNLKVNLDTSGTVEAKTEGNGNVTFTVQWQQAPQQDDKWQKDIKFSVKGDDKTSTTVTVSTQDKPASLLQLPPSNQSLIVVSGTEAKQDTTQSGSNTGASS